MFRADTRPAPAIGSGVQCDRCGANIGAELRTCRIEGKSITHGRLRPEMRLCVPCIGSLEAAGHTVHVKLTSAELRAQLRVVGRQRRPGPLEPSAEAPQPDPMSKAAARHAVPMLVDIARRAVDRAIGHRVTGHQSEERAVRWLAQAIERCCEKVHMAAKQMPALDRAQAKEAERRSAARKEIAAQMRAARAKLSAIKRAIQVADRQLEARDNRLVPPHERYPDAPAGSIRPSDTGAGLPEAPGIYFLWAGELVEYVGQSIKLCNRVKVGHHQLRKDHLISYVELDARELTWAECWYIGALRPKLNFGRHASHQRHAAPIAQPSSADCESRDGIRTHEAPEGTR